MPGLMAKGLFGVLVCTDFWPYPQYLLGSAMCGEDLAAQHLSGSSPAALATVLDRECRMID